MWNLCKERREGGGGQGICVIEDRQGELGELVEGKEGSYVGRCGGDWGMGGKEVQRRGDWF